MVVPLFVGRQKSIQRARRGDEQAEVHPARRADGGEDQRPGRGRHLPGRHARHGRAAAAPARRHGQGAGRGQEARARRCATSIRPSSSWSRPRRSRRSVDEDDRDRGADPRSINSTFENYVKLNKKIPPEMIMSVASIDDPARLADTIVAHLGIKLEDKQALLEIENPAERLEKRARLHAVRDRDPRGREAHPHSGQEADGEDPEGVLPQRADAGDPEGARREGRVQERDPGARGEDQAEEDVRRGQGEGGEGAEEAQDDVADVRRGDGRAQLHRLAHLAAVARVHRRQARHRGGREGPRGGSLRSREGEAAHPRVPRRAVAGRADEGPDPLPRRAAGRRQDLARQVDRARHGTQVRARLARRRARRGRDPRPPAHLHRRAARARSSSR